MKKIYSTCAVLLWLCYTLYGQLPKPSDTFGHSVGEDYKLASYDEMLSYYALLDSATERVKVIDIGHSVNGRPIKLVFISSIDNMKSLEQWQSISARMARATISKNEALELSKEGRAVVWLDGGMHATESAHAQMTAELIYKVASEENDEMKKIRDQVITLIVPVMNPDGLDLIKSWYTSQLGTPYETTYPPKLYQEYVGHDNNRDWFMNNMPETRAVTTILYQQWYPQIILNHHQSAPSWARIFIPPFKNPVNPRIHPGVTTGVNLIGAAMANRFAIKKMSGVISSTRYDMWWNGGMRTTPYYHNQIGILTETAHKTPTPRFYAPESIPKYVGGKPTDSTDIHYPSPWTGGESHFRDAVDYMITASMATLDMAADKKEEILYNIYSMGRDAIENTQEAFAYILPSKQRNHAEAVNLINILMQGGIEVHRAEQAFDAQGKSYPTGSYILYGAQAFRPYLADLMEPQFYPNLYQYQGGPPVQPYDLTGWTLPMQMDLAVSRIDKPFKVKAQLINKKAVINSGKIEGSGSYGFLFSPQSNIAALAVNNILAGGGEIAQIQDAWKNYKAGSFIIKKTAHTEDLIEQLREKTGLHFFGIDNEPSVPMKIISNIRVGLYKSWGPNIDEGWTRWVLEQFQFSVDTLDNEAIRSNNLSIYTAIIIPSENSYRIFHGHAPGTMPPSFTGGLGIEGMLALSQYVSNGGTLIAFDHACNVAIEQLGLPITNITKKLSSQKFYVPGSLLRININRNHPLAYGMPPELIVSFSKSVALEIKKPSRKKEGGVENIALPPKPKINIVAKYAEKDILASGWGVGVDEHIKNKGALAHVKYGKGDIILFGFRPQFRGQTRGSYKFIFNAIYMGATKK